MTQQQHKRTLICLPASYGSNFYTILRDANQDLNYFDGALKQVASSYYQGLRSVKVGLLCVPRFSRTQHLRELADVHLVALEKSQILSYRTEEYGSFSKNNRFRMHTSQEWKNIMYAPTHAHPDFITAFRKGVDYVSQASYFFIKALEAAMEIDDLHDEALSAHTYYQAIREELHAIHDIVNSSEPLQLTSGSFEGYLTLFKQPFKLEGCYIKELHEKAAAFGEAQRADSARERERAEVEFVNIVNPPPRENGEKGNQFDVPN